MHFDLGMIFQRVLEQTWRPPVILPMLVMALICACRGRWYFLELRSTTPALITALGDSNVVLRFHGWLDQRSYDLIQMKSESIRRGKLSREDAGTDMPEPIYRVEPNERGGGAKAVAAKTRATRPRSACHSITPDLSPNTDTTVQVDRDPLATSSTDLLDVQAPRE